MNLDPLNKELEHLSNRIASCRQQLAKMPPGKLIVTQSNHYFKWYISTNGHDDGIHYLSKSDPSNQLLAQKLALKKYLTCLLQESIEQEKSLISYIKTIKKAEKGSYALLFHPEYQKLIGHTFAPRDEILKKWVSETYESCQNHPENLKYHSPTGHILRSKSEVIIDMTLAMHQIPFRYEEKLTINENTYYPDFTIRHPKTGKFFYWEHFGLINNSDYLDKNLLKMRNYIKSGLIPSINLITTFETQENPLSPQLVEELIRIYFL